MRPLDLAQDQVRIHYLPPKILRVYVAHSDLFFCDQVANHNPITRFLKSKSHTFSRKKDNFQVVVNLFLKFWLAEEVTVFTHHIHDSSFLHSRRQRWKTRFQFSVQNEISEPKSILCRCLFSSAFEQKEGKVTYIIFILAVTLFLSSKFCYDGIVSFLCTLSYHQL